MSCSRSWFNIYKKYDYFIFVNSSVIGPYLPKNFKGNWTDIYINGLKKHKLFCMLLCSIIYPLNLEFNGFFQKSKKKFKKKFFLEN